MCVWLCDGQQGVSESCGRVSVKCSRFVAPGIRKTSVAIGSDPDDNADPDPDPNQCSVAGCCFVVGMCSTLYCAFIWFTAD